MNNFTCKRLLLLVLVLFSSGLLSVYAQPTDNPVTGKYPELVGHWTNQIKWSSVTNVTNVAGLLVQATAPLSDPRFPELTSGTVYIVDSTKLRQTMWAITDAGGGVLYFPSGYYVFSFNVLMTDQVVFRGDNPPSNENDAKQNNFSPPTRFVFPKYLYNDMTVVPNWTAFKRIATPKNGSNMGLINITINRATITFRPEWSTTIPLSTTYYPEFDAITTGGQPFTRSQVVTLSYGGKTYAKEQPITLLKNIIVLGVRQLNAAEPDEVVPKATQTNYTRIPNRKIANIDGFVWENCLVANCRLNDAENYTGTYTNTNYPVAKDDFTMNGYKFDNGALVGLPVIFSYTNHYGVAVNRMKLYTQNTTAYDNNISDWFGTNWAYTPDDEPGSMGRNLEIYDNWVMRTMRPSYQVGGIGVKMYNNVGTDRIEKPGEDQPVDPTGLKKPIGANTFENRGIDISGWNCYVVGNYIEAYRNKIGGYLSVDGEGILHQEASGSTINGMHILNNFSRNYIGLYKSRDMVTVDVSGNYTSGAPIWIWADANGAPFSLYDVTISNNTSTGQSLQIKGGVGGNNVHAFGNTSDNLSMSCYVKESNNTYNTITWWGAAGNPDGAPCVDPASYPTLVGITPAENITRGDADGLGLGTLVLSFNAGYTAVGDVSTLEYELFIDAIKVATGNPSATGGISYSWAIPNGFTQHSIECKVKEGGTNALASVSRSYSVVMTVGIATKTAANIDVNMYPNPAKDVLNLSFSQNVNDKISYAIVDMTGRVLRNAMVNQQNESISLSGLKKGMYFIQIQSGNAKTIKTFIKE